MECKDFEPSKTKTEGQGEVGACLLVFQFFTKLHFKSEKIYNSFVF